MGRFLEDCYYVPAVCARTADAAPGRASGMPGLRSGYLGVIFVILLPCIPRPAISPFCPKTKA
jgi:hypothetical protein